MESALIALAGVLIGILCNEHFRRRNRIEFYSQKIFDKRLSVYENLFVMLQNGYEIVCEVMEDEDSTEDERKDAIRAVMAPLAELLDTNAFYLDEYVTVHALVAFVGASEVMNHSEELEREAARSGVRESYREVKELIISESGATEVFKHFKAISKSKPDTAITRRMKELKKNRV
ncbi:hypothetical protein [Neptunomonas concharum]|uniref:Uncharacterized protein n=1 Tax=Neptunomonas concharum TaxID=1031538 RepID=A0A5P1RBE5_9GAMM|nr:hypothetical protein [Neptunomonas concharum]QEQ96606.1 hypothetical protein F0U83_07710 [Neptunomonas concharum]